MGNVVVTCSKSGKLSKRLYKYYLSRVLKDYVKNEEFLLIIDAWSGQVNTEMNDAIFSNDEDLPTCTLKVIPGKCTSTCQPLDVYRQVKILIKKMQQNAVLNHEKREIYSQEDQIKIHSIILHQLGADVFNPITE